jgi:UDP-galactopyranose mutase
MTDNYQGTAMMNYTDIDVPYTRIIEHKHFENIESDTTHITFEYPQEYKADETDPYYPVNDSKNNSKYQLYKDLADKETNIIFGGRLAEYKYYDMHQVIESALNKTKEIIWQHSTQTEK